MNIVIDETPSYFDSTCSSWVEMDILSVVWSIFQREFMLFAAPFYIPDSLWVILPIYLNWLVTEYFQEKRGVDFPNAICNGFVMLWVGVDWLRTSVRMYPTPVSEIILRVILSLFCVIYGAVVMLEGARGSSLTFYFGRIREVTYFLLVLTPVFYGFVPPDLVTLVAIVMFFPVFYLGVLIVDELLPSPKVLDKWERPTWWE